jgi:hypothetical protein
MTTSTTIKPEAASVESLAQRDRDSFKAQLRESLQEVLEAGMTEALGAAPAGRAPQCWHHGADGVIVSRPPSEAIRRPGPAKTGLAW